MPISHSRQNPLIRPARADLPRSNINHRLVNPLSANGSRSNDARQLGLTQHWLSHRYPRYGQWTILSGRRDPFSSRHRPRLWNSNARMVDEPLQPAIADSFAGAIEDAVSSRLGLRGDLILPQPQSRIETERGLLDQMNLTFNSRLDAGNGAVNVEQIRSASPPFFRPRQRQRRDDDDRADQGTRLREILASLRHDNLGETRANEHGQFVPGQPQGDNGAQGTTEDAPNHRDNDSQEEDDLEPIDPEFLAALPPDIQQEVLENHEQERQSRRRARAAANRQGGASDALISELLSNIPEDLQDEALLSIDAAFGERNESPADNNDDNNNNNVNNNVPFGGEVLPRTPINLPYANSDFEEDVESDEDLFNGNRRIRLENERRRGPTHFMGRDAAGVERMLFELTSARPRLTDTGDLLKETKPILDADQIPHLLRLLSIPKWEGRVHLNRTMRNLSESRELAKSIFGQIFCLLRCPISTSEQRFDLLHDEIVKSKYPSPDTLMLLNEQVIETAGSKTAIESFGFESISDEVNDGVLDASVVRRLLELLRNIFVPGNMSVILELDVQSVYSTFHLRKLEPSSSLQEKDSTIQALMVLITLPLREEIARAPSTRGVALEVRITLV